MNKINFLVVVVIALIITNAILILFLVNHKPPHPHGNEGPRAIIIERLGLDSKQIKAYDQLISWHKNEISSAESKIMVLKNKLYQQLTLPQSLAKRDSLITEINVEQKRIEQAHYRHFEDLLVLCHEDQLDEYETLAQEISQLFANGRPKNRKDDKD